jgi:hypothetical protein
MKINSEEFSIFMDNNEDLRDRLEEIITNYQIGSEVIYPFISDLIIKSQKENNEKK